MHTARRRPRTWKIVIIAVLVVAIGEPIVMYQLLAREKQQRRTALELTLQATTVAQKASVE